VKACDLNDGSRRTPATPEARFAPRDVDSGGKDDDCADPGPSIDDFTERQIGNAYRKRQF
jgi:hypothetical protein